MANKRDRFERLVSDSKSEPENQGDRIIVKPMEGMHIACDPNDESLTPCLTRDGYWESWISAWLANEVDEHEEFNFVDAGANVGYYSSLARVLGGNVVAFEPLAETYKLLHETVNFTTGPGAKATFELALSSEPGKYTAIREGNLVGSTHLAEVQKGDKDREEVYATTLSSIVSVVSRVLPIGLPTIFKMDVEGFEEKAWDGSLLFLNVYSPTVVLEYTPGSYSEEFNSKLAKYGDMFVIGFDGEEKPITEEELKIKPDWSMIVIRKRD